MVAVPSTRARWSTGPDPRSAARVWTSRNPGAIGAFRVHIEPSGSHPFRHNVAVGPTSQPAPRAPERGPSQ
jgi:hypothetical protein